MSPDPSDSTSNLETDRIVAAAIAYIDVHGIRDMSMRRLGASLGVEAMALYRYLPSRDAVIDAVVERLVDQLYEDPELQLAASTSWQDYLQQMAHAVRTLSADHPQAFPLIATRSPAAPWIRPPLRSLRLAESFLAALVHYGFSADASAAAYRGFTSFLVGHLLLEVSALGVDVSPADKGASEREATGDLREFPRLQDLEDRLSEDWSDEEFEASLESLLDRLEASLPSSMRRAALSAT